MDESAPPRLDMERAQTGELVEPLVSDLGLCNVSFILFVLFALFAKQGTLVLEFGDLRR